MTDIIEVEYEGYVAVVRRDASGVAVIQCSNPGLVGASQALSVAARYSFFLLLVQHAVASLVGPADLPFVIKD